MLRVFQRVSTPTATAIRRKRASYRIGLISLFPRPRFFSAAPSEDETCFGEYAVILPPDPPLWGVSHIIPRTVPKHIPRPPYARSKALGSDHDDPYLGDPYDGHGKVVLNSEAETSLRAAALLARHTLEMIGSHIQVPIATSLLTYCLWLISCD